MSSSSSSLDFEVGVEVVIKTGLCILKRMLSSSLSIGLLPFGGDLEGFRKQLTVCSLARISELKDKGGVGTNVPPSSTISSNILLLI